MWAGSSAAARVPSPNSQATRTGAAPSVTVASKRTSSGATPASTSAAADTVGGVVVGLVAEVLGALEVSLEVAVDPPVVPAVVAPLEGVASSPPHAATRSQATHIGPMRALISTPLCARLLMSER